MAVYTTIDDPTLYFNTSAVWSGDDSEHIISGIGHQPDFTWIKGVNIATQHYIFDSVRGATKYLIGNGTNAEATNAQTLKSWNSDGFVLGTSDDVNGGSRTYVSWNWKAGTSVSGNTSGGTAKAYSGSVNTDAGISIITYLGNDNSAHVIPHHLGVSPELTIIKERSNADIWVVQNVYSGFGNYMTLQTDSASATNGGNFITSVDSTAVTMNENAVNNANDESYILYSFASKQGYSKIGTYTGNGNADGTFVYLGFKPAYIMYKKTSAVGRWSIRDNKRDPFNVATKGLEANGSTAENTGSNYWDLDMLSNGFKLRTTEHESNGSGLSFVYMAFAEAPFVTSTGVPATAR